MKKLIRAERLDNGLVVEFYDRSNRYFGDYHRVCLEVSCRIPLTVELFNSSADPAGTLQQAMGLFGAEAVFSRRLEKMGVEGDAVEQARAELTDSFLRTTVAYLGSSDFPARYVAAEMQRRRTGRRPQWPQI